MANTPLKITQDPFVPLNSLVLITGVNGLIASHVADQVLAAGYRVRGSVRSKARCAWVESFFTARYGANRIEVVEVPDITAPGVWNAQVAGVSAVIAVAGCCWIADKDVAKGVNEELKCLYGLLHAAKTYTDTVKAFIYTSSSWAAYTPKVGVPVRTLTEESWNHEAVALAADKNVPDEGKVKGYTPFMAIKVKVEEAMWDWVAREKPKFTFNSILISTVIGPILDPGSQQGSTAGLVRALYNGGPKEAIDFVEGLGSGPHIDARDSGRLYLGVLVSGLNASRVYGFAGRLNWKQALDILKELYPEKKDWLELSTSYECDEYEIQSDIPLKLLRVVGQERWTSLRESIKDAAVGFVSTGQSSAETPRVD